MVSDRLLRRSRWGALSLCASTALVAAVDTSEASGISGWVGKPALIAVATIYSALLAVVLRPESVSSSRRLRTRCLGLAMAVSVALDIDNLAALNLFALPFAIPSGRRRRWLWAQAGVLALQLLALFNLRDPAQRAKLAEVWSLQGRELMAALGAGVLQMLAWGLFAYLVGSLLVQLEIDRQMLQRANAELRATQTMLAETTRIEERLRISRELHDSVGHYLTSLGLQLEIVENVGGPVVSGPLGRAKLLVRLLLAEVREAATAWRVEKPDALPGAIRELCQSVTHLQVRLDLADDLPAASPGTTHALFRIVQEALTNTLRHSDARTFSVRLGNRDDRFELDVHDDGRGALQYSIGNGLTAMKERVREAGGDLQIDSSRGFHIHALIPAAKGREL